MNQELSKNAENILKYLVKSKQGGFCLIHNSRFLILSLFYQKNKNPARTGDFWWLKRHELFRLLFGEGADGLSGESNLHAIDMLGLKINLEGTPGGDIGMTAGIAGFGTAAGHLADSGHKNTRIKNYGARIKRNTKRKKRNSNLISCAF